MKIGLDVGSTTLKCVVLDEKEKAYYDYTCQAEDIIRMCNIPSPRMTEEDLIVEKKILSL